VLAGRRAYALAALAVFGLVPLASGCGERGEPVAGAADLYPLTIGTADDALLTIPAPARRIVLLDGSARAILGGLGAGTRIAGVIATDGDRLRPGALRDLRPDLVVAPPGTDDRVLSQAGAVTQAPVYVTPDTSIREVERAITQLGLMTAEPTAARRVVHDIEQRRRGVNRRLRGIARPSVFVDLGDFTTASDQTLIGDLIREAHGRNIAGDLPDGLPLTIGQLRAIDPDVYVATAASGTTLETLRKNPRTKRLRAVRNGRVVVIDEQLLSPAPAIGVGLEQLARALHPDASP
jgi:ABC-type Fe3+-hydroxamate transport system substrate-binding protein